MRICYLSTFYPFRGGIAQFNAALYRAFESQHEMHAITFTRQYPNILFPGETQYVTEGDKVDEIDSRIWLDSVNPFSWLKTRKRVKKIAPDLILMKFWMPFFGPSLGAVCAKQKKQTKRIAILDNVIPHEKRIIDMPFTRYFLKRTDGYIVMSEKVRDDLLSLKPTAKYRLVKHPLYDHFGKTLNQTEARKSLNLDPDKKTLLFFGFIRDYKGLDLLIEAFNHLDDTYQLVIAGEVYGSFEKYDKLIEQNTDSEHIHKHIKYIGDSEVPLYFSAADACILPYKSATQSGITSIAFHFELPIIATDVGGLKELVQHGKTGEIIPKADVSSIAKGIFNFFENNKAASYRQNIHNEKSEMTWDYLANQITELYQEIS
ncbi:MAG: glycosyltransferase [Bacteroidales bacterium]|jgi:glycosyltransferase involved in cell wall biosynthesis|nr:glycosyltransferase [Bacteroidales bacterium]